MTDVNDILANAQRPELPVDVYLGPPDLPGERLGLDREKRTAKNQAALDEVARQMRATTLTTRVRALPHREWADLVVAHPPRDGVDDDRRKGVNNATFWAAAVPACLPDLTRDQYEKLDAVVSEGEWGKLCAVVEAVNTGAVIVPKLPDGSPTSPDSEPT